MIKVNSIQKISKTFLKNEKEIGYQSNKDFSVFDDLK